MVLRKGIKEVMVVADLLENVTIQGNVVITTFNEETEDMVVLWETEDFEYDAYSIPYGVAMAEVLYMYARNNIVDEYGVLVIEVKLEDGNGENNVVLFQV